MTLVLCADIGGTNANFCIAEINETISLGTISQIPTSDFEDSLSFVQRLLDSCEKTPDAACFAIAGPVKDQHVEMTNSNLVFDADEICKKTDLRNLLLINDFEAIGFATNILNDSDYKVINPGKEEKHAAKAVIGAGTGLGKNILTFEEEIEAYLPHPSEGGHADFPVHSEEEWELTQSLSSRTYEELLSGRGLENIYRWLQKKKHPGEQGNLSAREISKQKDSNPCSKETFELFIKFYARCAKNFTLDTYALGGIFIAGGIAAANDEIFGRNFVEEFTRHENQRFHELLKNVPVRLITNYHISLKGTAFAIKIKRL